MHGVLISTNPKEYKVIRGPGFTDKEGVKHPIQILDKWSENELRAIGVYPVDVVSKVNPRWHDDLQDTLTLNNQRLKLTITGTYNAGKFLAHQKRQVQKLMESKLQAVVGSSEDRITTLTGGVILLYKKGSNSNDPQALQLLAVAEWTQAVRTHAAQLILDLDSDPATDIEAGWPTIPQALQK